MTKSVVMPALLLACLSGPALAGATQTAVEVSDSALAARVEAAIQHADIRAEAKDGVVTLKGQVASVLGREVAVQRASSIRGVRAVKSQLRVEG